MNVPFEAIIWIVLGIVFAVIEGATVQLVSIWFAIGAAAAAVISGFGFDFIMQFFVFCAVSGLLLAVTRPLVKKKIAVPKQSTNADSNIGRIAVVLEEINNSAATGRVNVAGLDWTARSDTNAVIPVGKNVKVLRIEGVKLIVETVMD